MSVVRELWAFLRVRKKWWLVPMVLVMALVGGLLIIGEASPVAPFIYTVF